MMIILYGHSRYTLSAVQNYASFAVINAKNFWTAIYGSIFVLNVFCT